MLRNLPENDRIVEELKASGLAGLGGAGFPTGVKWEAVAREPGPRYVVVNADEGEPGTIKDRYVMELRPHLMLEGMLVAMRFAEATEGLIYLREEYATARVRLLAAIEELRAAGILDGLSIELVVGAGAYICGEETAMLESMEGRRGMPRLKPPFPSQVGYLGRPTLINNVETLAHIPAILRLGGEAWPHVRLWSISGAVAQPGCYEAPVDVTLRELIDEHAGGATEEIGAIVPGGAASGILPPDGARRAAHARRPPRVGRRRRLGGGAGLSQELLAPPAAGGDDALLRRGVLPEVHAVPDREPRHAPPARGARARTGRDVARADRGVARRDGGHVDLRPRARRALPHARGLPLLAGALRPARRADAYGVTRRRATLDRDDPLARFRDEFVHEEGGPLYVDGNSLGRLPKRTQAALAAGRGALGKRPRPRVARLDRAPDGGRRRARGARPRRAAR